MYYIKYLAFVIVFFILQSSNLFAEKIVYLNIEKIMKTSNAGKAIISKINETNQKNLKKFKKIEEDLKKDEQDLIAKKNILNEDEFKKKFNLLKKKINDYKSLRQTSIEDITTKRRKASSEFFKQINPLLGKYATDNDISFILRKQNIIMGKTELDITNDILKIVDTEISKIKFE
jgi:outer membrane protein